MQTVCLYSPFPTRATLVGAPPCARRVQGEGGALFPPPFRAGFAPPRLGAQTENVERRTKVRPHPFDPAPAQVEQDGERRTPCRTPLYHAPVYA